MMSSINVKTLPDDLISKIIKKTTMKGVPKIQKKIFLEPQKFNELIKKITQICSYQVIDKNTRNIKIKKLSQVFKDKMLIFHGYELSLKQITYPRNNDVLTWALIEMNEYLTPLKIREYLLQFFNKIDFSIPDVYNRLQLLYQELELRNMPRIDHESNLLKNYVIRDIISNKDYKNRNNDFYNIANFLQYVNNNIKQFDEKIIDELIEYIATNKMIVLCTNILAELRTLMN